MLPTNLVKHLIESKITISIREWNVIDNRIFEWVVAIDKKNIGCFHLIIIIRQI